MQDRFWIVGIFNILSYAENISTLSYVVFYIVFAALIRELSHFYSERTSRFNYLKNGLLTFLRQTARQGRRDQEQEEVSLLYRVEKQPLAAAALVFRIVGVLE
jgi:hypothetical protein